MSQKYAAKSSSRKRRFQIKRYYPIIAIALLVAFSGVIGVTVLKAPLISKGAEPLRISVYNSGFALVSQQESLHLYKGINTVIYDSIPGLLEPDSVSLTPRGNSAFVREQLFLRPSSSRTSILSHYIGSKVRGYQVVGNDRIMVEGELLSFDGSDFVIRTEEGKIRIVPLSDIELPENSDGFEIVSKPALKWLVDAPEENDYSFDLSYLTGGLSWEASYSGVLNEDEDLMDVSSWVSISNNANFEFRNARITVVAGSVSRASPSRNPAYPVALAAGKAALEGADASRSASYASGYLSEYYSFTFSSPADIPAGSVKQLSFISAKGVPVEKRFVFDSSSRVFRSSSSSPDDFRPVSVNIVFSNDESSNLGFPLPAGTFKLYKRSSSGLEFIGEDSVGHTSVKGKISLSVGSSFDVLAKKFQTNFERLGSSASEYSFRVVLRNNRNSDVVVHVVEHPYGDWKVASESVPHRKVSQNRIEWAVLVPARSEEALDYTIQYTYRN